MHNSKEIVNLEGLFVLTVGYVDMKTYPLTKYYYIGFFYIAFVLTIQKRFRFEPGPPSPLFLATPLNVVNKMQEKQL